ncbi:MAG: hypothetical protein ACR2J3_00065 [Aridibacter sp.]
MKKIYILFTLFWLCSSVAHSQERRTEITKKDVVAEVPKEATIVINFLGLPGKDNLKSNWEVSYELRIIDRKSETEAVKAGRLKYMSSEEEKIGDFILKNSFRKTNLSQTENRQVVLKIPLDEKIRAKLKNAQELKQTFLFYGSALVFDAKLKKNIIIPLSWIWRYELYPEANFGMEFKIEENSGDSDYTYMRNTFVPEKLPEAYFTIGSPSTKQ